MESKSDALKTLIEEKHQRMRRFKPCLRIPSTLQSTVEGKLNIIIRKKKKSPKCSPMKLENFDIGDIERFSSIRDTSEKFEDSFSESKNEEEIEEENPSVSSFNIVKKCQLLNGIIMDSQDPKVSVNVGQSGDNNQGFEFLKDLESCDPKPRIKKENIEWGNDVHDIYDPFFSSGSEEDEKNQQSTNLTELKSKSKGSIHIKSFIDNKKKKVIHHNKPMRIKKLDLKPDYRTMQKINTPLSIGIGVPMMDFKKKVKPRAESIKPTKTKCTFKAAPHFKSKIVPSNNITSNYLSNRKTRFDLKDYSSAKKKKLESNKAKLSPKKGLGTFEERFKAFSNTKTDIRSMAKRKIGSLNYRHNISALSNRRENKSSSIHF